MPAVSSRLFTASLAAAALDPSTILDGSVDTAVSAGCGGSVGCASAYGAGASFLISGVTGGVDFSSFPYSSQFNIFFLHKIY